MAAICCIPQNVFDIQDCCSMISVNLNETFHSCVNINIKIMLLEWYYWQRIEELIIGKEKWQYMQKWCLVLIIVYLFVFVLVILYFFLLDM